MAIWVILGCGYVGSALARRLAGGHQVIVTRRTLAAARAIAAETGAEPLAVDLASENRVGDTRFGEAIVVCCAPPGPDSRAEVGRLVAGRLVYVSSTAVYPPAGGAWVDEAWPLAPATAAGCARVLAESALPPGAIALRVAGIHGPGRGLVDRIRAGTYRIVGDGTAHVSRIHVEDLVEAIVAAGTGTATGAINIADDDPAPIGEVADAIAARLGVAPPPRVPASSVDPEIAGMLGADRRIANGRMKRELGVVLRYPSWRSGL